MAQALKNPPQDPPQMALFLRLYAQAEQMRWDEQTPYGQSIMAQLRAQVKALTDLTS